MMHEQSAKDIVIAENYIIITSVARSLNNRPLSKLNLVFSKLSTRSQLNCYYV